MYKAGVGPIFGAPYSDKHRTVVAAAAAAAVAVVVVVVAAALFNLVVVRPYSRIEQDNSKPQNNNRWTQNGWGGGGLFGGLDKIPGSQLVHNADADGLLAFGRLGGASGSARRVFQGQ